MANSEVLFLKLQTKRSKQRAEYLQSNTRTKLKPERSTRPIPKKKKASVRDSYKADIESKRSAKRWRYEEDPKENRAAQRRRYEEDPEGNRAANREKYQLPLKHLKGVGIEMIPLSDWLNVLPRGRGTAGVTELPLPPKGML